MKPNNDTPSIRFAGFTDAWEQRRLGEVVDRVVRKNTNNESSFPLTISAQYGLVDQITYFNNRVASRDVSNYYLVLNGEFAYNKSSSDGFPFGTIKRLDLYNMGVLSTLYIVFSIKNADQLNSDFLTVYFDTNRWHKGVSERAAEGARNHGLLNISAEVFLDIDITIPRDEKEQAAIGSLFEDINRLITLHQRKLEHLQNIKKACLEKMFPQNGEAVPEVRFAGFTDAWEQRKLGELAQIRTGFPFDSKDFVSTGTYLVVTNGNIQDDSPTVDNRIGNRIDVSNDHIKEQYALDIGDILVTMDGTVGKTAKVAHTQLILAQRVGRISTNDNSEFIYQALNTGSFFEDMTALSHGGTIKHISLDEISEYMFRVPLNKKEEILIGSFFRKFDHLITLHQRKLERLQNIKKACLEKMFV